MLCFEFLALVVSMAMRMAMRMTMRMVVGVTMRMVVTVTVVAMKGSRRGGGRAVLIFAGDVYMGSRDGTL